MYAYSKVYVVAKTLAINFFKKNSIYPLPDAAFLKISGAKLE